MKDEFWIPQHVWEKMAQNIIANNALMNRVLRDMPPPRKPTAAEKMRIRLLELRWRIRGALLVLRGKASWEMGE